MLIGLNIGGQFPLGFKLHAFNMYIAGMKYRERSVWDAESGACVQVGDRRITRNVADQYLVPGIP